MSLSHCKEIKSMTIPPSLYQAATATTIPGSPELFKKLTGADWINAIRIEQSASILHIPPNRTEWELMDFLQPAYTTYLQSSPQLAIHETSTPGAYTLHAAQSIERGTIVTEYLGEWSQQSTRLSSYRWGPIDALHYRNCGGMVEDGFPNLAAFHLYGVDGLPLRILFVALEPIATNEMLVINYGMSHSVKINYHTEYKLNMMLDFFSKNPLDHIFKKISEANSRKRMELGWNKCLELESLVAKVQYLYQTPSAIMNLLIHNTVTAQIVFDLLDRIDNRFYILGFPLSPNRRQKEIMDHVQVLKTYFLGQRQFDAILQELIQRIRIRVVIQVFLKGVLKNENSEFLFQESLALNSGLDAVVSGNKEEYIRCLQKSHNKEQFTEEAMIFAQEIRSPTIEWFK